LGDIPEALAAVTAFVANETPNSNGFIGQSGFRVNDHRRNVALSLQCSDGSSTSLQKATA